MELTGVLLRMAEAQLKRFLPQTQHAYGHLVLRNRPGPFRSDRGKVLVDRWPEFNVMICKPQYLQMGVLKYILVFANDEAVLEETMRKSSVIDWTKYLCLGFNLQHKEIFKAVASEKGVPSRELAVCHMMTLEDISNLPSIDSSGISLSSLDESHVNLVTQTWKFGKKGQAVSVIRDMITNFPSYCVLDAEAKPLSWILTYESCAMGVLYTLPEHRGKGYAKVLVSTMAKTLHAKGYPVYCHIEEYNKISYSLIKKLGFTEDPSYREVWFEFNHL